MQLLSNLNDAHHILMGSLNGMREVALGTLSISSTLKVIETNVPN